MRVSLKDVTGVQDVQVSLSKGLATATLAPGNSVRYEQLLRAIEKNGFVIKGATLVADGTVVPAGSGFEFQISGSNERLKLSPAEDSAPLNATLAGKAVEVTGDVPEVAKGKTADQIQCKSLVEKH